MKEYKKLNERFFSDRLPQNMVVRFGNTDSDDANGYFDEEDKEIVIDVRLKSVEKFVIIVLLHEMAHVDLGMQGYVGYPNDGGHGMHFHVKLVQLFQAGAYDNLL
jgi:hypothetical protein